MFLNSVCSHNVIMPIYSPWFFCMGFYQYFYQTIQTNMSHSTGLYMHDQFAKPQSNGTAQLKKTNSSIEHSFHAYSNAIKIGWKNKTFKKRTANVQMFRAVVCNQMSFLVTRSAAWIKLWIYATDMVCRSRIQPFFSGRVDQTPESSGNRAYFYAYCKKMLCLQGVLVVAMRSETQSFCLHWQNKNQSRTQCTNQETTAPSQDCQVLLND